MIIGLGSDIVSIERIDKVMARFGEAFLKRILTKTEQEIASHYPPFKKLRYVAKRFAAKEACAKALGTGFREGVSFQDMEITSTGMGKPELQLKGRSAAYLKTITPEGKKAILWLSLSDDAPFAQAVVIIEAR